MRNKRWIKGITFFFALTVICLASVFFYLFFSAQGKAEAPYVQGSPENVNDTVTKQSESAVPLTSDNKKLPEIPTTKGTKGTKDNPFVVLEIVPDHSEDAMRYLVSSQEEGLPFDPVELGRQFCDEFDTNLVSYKDNSTNFNNLLSDKVGGVFNNNNHYSIYAGKGDETECAVDYTTIKEIHSIETTKISQKDMESGMTIKELAAKYESVFKKDKEENIIKENEIKDERNWEKVKEDTPYRDYKVLTIDGIKAADYENMTIKELADKYADKGLFKKSEDGKTIAADSLLDEEGWTREKSMTGMSLEEISETKSTGYLLNVGKGNGDFRMTSIWTQQDQPYHMVKSDNKDENQWKYVEKLPDGMYDIFSVWEKYQIADRINDGSLEKGYISLSDLEKAKLVSQEGGWHGDIPQYCFTYKKYQYKFNYYGLTVNDILKRRLFYRQTLEAYDNFHIRVISLTPAEINEMDQNDTPETLSYVERADMFYVAMFNERDDNIKKHINFYKKYVKGQKTVKPSDDVTFYDYYDNDLEWNDCMKIMKRLATNKNLPMMYENVVGDMVNQGVNEDGSISCHIYLNENKQDLHQVGSLNNIAKMYLTTVQLDLTKEAKSLKEGEEPQKDITFLRDIYPKFKQIQLVSREDANPHSAKYTGYYERNNGTLLCSCQPKEGATEQEIAELSDYKRRCFYLWGKAMFFPEEIIEGDFQKLIDNYGYLSNYIAGKDPSAFDNDKYDGGLDRANSTRGDDEKNVTVVYDTAANTNKTILDNGGFNTMGRIAEEILANGGKTAEDIVVYATKNKREYVRLDESDIMLDYSKKAKFAGNKLITLKCNVKNINNEDGVLTSITFLKSNSDSSGKVLEVKNMEKEEVFQDILGYRIPKEGTIQIQIPFSRQMWHHGYDVIRFETKGICSYIRKGKIKYSAINTKEYDIHVDQRKLFDLE